MTLTMCEAIAMVVMGVGVGTFVTFPFHMWLAERYVRIMAERDEEDRLWRIKNGLR